MTKKEFEELKSLIEKARLKKMTKAEIIAQRRNWVLNSAPEGMEFKKQDLEEVMN